MAKSRERIQARKLRRQGKSINKIAQKLKVSKSSVSKWCSDIELTKQQIIALIKRENDGAAKGRIIAASLKKKERIQRMKRLMVVGQKTIGRLTKRDILLIGTAIYWAEGSKKHRRTIFANSDPAMINFFIKWVKNAFNISRQDLTCYVSINQIHQSRINEVEKFWNSSTKVSLQNFTKPSFKKVKNKKIYENFTNHYGTLFVRVRRSTNLNYRILGQIEGLKAAV